MARGGNDLDDGSDSGGSDTDGGDSTASLNENNKKAKVMDPAAIIQRDYELEGMHLLTQIELPKSNTIENVILERMTCNE